VALSAMLVAMALISGATSGQGVAVVPVAFGATAPPLAEATGLAAALGDSFSPVLAPGAVATRLRRGARPVEVDLEALQQTHQTAIESADRAESVLALEGVVTALEADPSPTEEETALLQQSRLRLAQSLYQQAFFTRDREQTAAMQDRIFVHLETALRTDPYIAMPLGTYSPEVRRLLDLARRRLADQPKGSLQVRSTPEGATVRLDGRSVGRLTSEQTLSQRVAFAVGEELSVAVVVITGLVSTEQGDWFFGALYDLVEHRELRRCALRSEEISPASLQRMADCLGQEEVAAAETSLALPLEESGLATFAPAAAAVDEGVSPLLVAGVATGAAGAAALLVGVAGFATWGIGYGGLAGGVDDQSYESVEEDYAFAKLGWNLGWGAGLVGAAALAAGGGLLLYWFLGEQASDDGEGDP